MIDSNVWKVDLLKDIFPEDLYDHVMSKIGLLGGSKDWDKLWWLTQASKNFTVGSSWDIIREYGVVHRDLRFIWDLGIPFKVFFFLLEIVKEKDTSREFSC